MQVVIFRLHGHRLIRPRGRRQISAPRGTCRPRRPSSDKWALLNLSYGGNTVPATHRVSGSLGVPVCAPISLDRSMKAVDPRPDRFFDHAQIATAHMGLSLQRASTTPRVTAVDLGITKVAI